MKLKPNDIIRLEYVFDDVRYSCGADIHDIIDVNENDLFILENVFVKLSHTCKSLVEIPYYSVGAYYVFIAVLLKVFARILFFTPFLQNVLEIKSNQKRSLLANLMPRIKETKRFKDYKRAVYLGSTFTFWSTII